MERKKWSHKIFNRLVAMEEIQEQRHWLTNNKRPIVVVILLILIPIANFYFANWFYWYQWELNPELDPLYKPSHNMTVWIQPDDEEFHLHLDFYGSEDDLYAEVNRFSGYTIRVEPFDDEKNDCLLYTIPDDALYVWVRIYFTNEEGDPFLVQRLEMGRKITTELLSREISILLVPYHE